MHIRTIRTSVIIKSTLKKPIRRSHQRYRYMRYIGVRHTRDINSYLDNVGGTQEKTLLLTVRVTHITHLLADYFQRNTPIQACAVRHGTSETTGSQIKNMTHRIASLLSVYMCFGLNAESASCYCLSGKEKGPAIVLMLVVNATEVNLPRHECRHIITDRV